MEILSHKDDWGDTPLNDAASKSYLHIVLQFLKDPVYFSRDSWNHLVAEKMWFSDTKECRTVNRLLLSELGASSDNESDVSKLPLSDAAGQETQDIDSSLAEICYWAILNGCLKLMKACVSRAKALNQDLTLETESITWLHILAIGCDGDPKTDPELIPVQLVPPQSRSGLNQDSKGITPLHLAVKHARVKMVEYFLDWAPNESGSSLKGILRQTLDESKDTAISLATAGERSEHRKIANLLWNRIKKDAKEQIKEQIQSSKPGSVKPELNEQTELALELAARFEPPSEGAFLKDILGQITKDKKIESDVLSLAIYHQLPKVVWWLLSNGAYINERNIDEGTFILKNLPIKSRRGLQWSQINELLENPPRLTKSGSRGGDGLLPEIESKLDDYHEFPDGTIVDFLHAKGSTETTLQLKRRSLTDIIHALGPQRIMDLGNVSYDAFFQPKKDATAIGATPGISKTKHLHLGDQRKAVSYAGFLPRVLLLSILLRRMIRSRQTRRQLIPSQREGKTSNRNKK